MFCLCIAYVVNELLELAFARAWFLRSCSIGLVLCSLLQVFCMGLGLSIVSWWLCGAIWVYEFTGCSS